MEYIIFDLEFNQNFGAVNSKDAQEASSHNLFEIIQIGAVKLDAGLHTIAYFSRYIKPSVFTEINPFVSKLTGITMEQLRAS
ncbi:MAG: exonuclease domain-containing protein, partial [Clostridia bacterium]|nr:exonuclease domain-containing protein [Clostridia bacterium]